MYANDIQHMRMISAGTFQGRTLEGGVRSLFAYFQNQSTLPIGIAELLPQLLLNLFVRQPGIFLVNVVLVCASYSLPNAACCIETTCMLPMHAPFQLLILYNTGLAFCNTLGRPSTTRWSDLLQHAGHTCWSHIDLQCLARCDVPL
eukprot:366360-Chlamydomonas_euryale.AAC.7